jgi:hypothetical protein
MWNKFQWFLDWLGSQTKPGSSRSSRGKTVTGAAGALSEAPWWDLLLLFLASGMIAWMFHCLAEL